MIVEAKPRYLNFHVPCQGHEGGIEDGIKLALASWSQLLGFLQVERGNNGHELDSRDVFFCVWGCYVFFSRGLIKRLFY